MSEPTYPDELRYHEAHDWARVDGDVATFGITWYGELESVKAVSDLIAPLSGEVTAVNDEVVARPERVNEAP